MDKCCYQKKCQNCFALCEEYDDFFGKKILDIKNEINDNLKNCFDDKNFDIDKINAIKMDKPFHYRHKVTGIFTYKKGKIYEGLYENGTHNVVDIDKNSGFCLIENELAANIIWTIKNIATKYKMSIYNENSGIGLLRYVVVRVNKDNTEALVTLVMTRNQFEGKNNFIKLLTNAHKEIKSIYLNINDKNNTKILGDRNIKIYGLDYINDAIGDYKFIITPSDFYQVNPIMCEKLYNVAHSYIKNEKIDTLVDAYSGVGTIGIYLNSCASKIISIELNSAAVHDAIKNAKMNNIKNINFYNEDSTAFLDSISDDDIKIDCLILDPPRSGTTREFIEAINDLDIKLVLYISCDIKTYMRDVKYFSKLGYKINKMTLVDMFPWTDKIETVSLLRKQRGVL